MPDHVATHWPELIALEEFLQRLTSDTYGITAAGVNIPALVEALKAHEQRGGRVPWR